MKINKFLPMKNILKTTIFAFLLVSLGSCEIENENPVPSPNGIILEGLTPNGPYVLSAEDGDNPLTTFKWTKTDNGVATIPSSYVIQIAKSGTNFENPIATSPSSTEIAYTWTEGYLDPILLANNFVPDEAADIDIRVKSTLGLGASPYIQYSNVVTTKITPFAQPSFAFTKEGDNPANAPKLISSSLFTTDCEGYAWLEPGDYKLYTSVKNVYQTSNPYYGSNGSGGLELNGSPINITTAGFYLIKADTNLNAYSTLSTIWGVYGSATPAPSEITVAPQKRMTYNPATKNWEMTVTLTGGKILRFGNLTKALNLGLFDANKVGVEYAGKVMSYNGVNIIIPGTGDSKYKLTLDLNTPRAYTFTIVKQE